MRVLVAEDDSITRRLPESHLIKWGHNVVVCVDGGEAWGILTRDDSPKLAILDWLMPLPASGSGRSSFIRNQGTGPQPGGTVAGLGLSRVTLSEKPRLTWLEPGCGLDAVHRKGLRYDH